MIKAGDEVVALVTEKGAYDTLIKGDIYTVESTGHYDSGEQWVRLRGQHGRWFTDFNGVAQLRKVTRPRVSASSELTKKLTEEVREGEKRKEIEYEPATANK